TYDGYNGTADKPLKVLNHPSHNIDENGICINCGAKVSFSLTVSGGTVVNKEIRKDLTSDFYVATITAPVQKPGTDLYFVYWRDTDTGEVVSTYTTYSFFLVRETNLEAVYASRQNYTAERNKGVQVSRVVTLKENKEANKYYLYVEHSV
ncbi:MAG TPA: hypothetical protein DIW36_08440, partial [Ruminococcaceae bacterium]|nr:hypothetical protein [Oscillospiraceae bacterium]